MAMFRCARCKQVYEEYYPVDDTCLKCKKGTVRIISRIKTNLSSRRTYL